MSAATADNHYSLILNYFVTELSEMSASVTVCRLYWQLSILM